MFYISTKKQFENTAKGDTKMEESKLLLLLLPVLIIQLGLMIFALIDLIKIPVTNGPKWMWGVIIVVVNIIGPILYFVIGRRNY